MSITDRIRSKLFAWKASLLSITGRALLVKSVTQGMLIYRFTVYAWPVSLIKLIDKWLSKFISSRDLCTKKLVIVAWHKVCRPVLEGGPGSGIS